MEAGPAGIGEHIRGYVNERVLGQGGMGCVYLAHHEHLKKKVAIKVLDASLTDDEHFIARFFAEAKIVNNVNHPNIVDIIDFVQSDSPRRVAYIMEYVEGPPLNTAIKNHDFTPVQAINICRQIGGALSAVHAIHVVHRDLKPANILLMESPESSDFSNYPSIKVVDFGIAKIEGGSIEHRTNTGAMLGTPAYMSPEQVASDPVSSKTDVYALGEILFELITGAPAFEGENLGILRQKLAHIAPDLSMDSDVPCHKEILGLVRNCLQPDPDKRPALQEVIDGLNFIHGKLEDKPVRPITMTSNPDLQAITERPKSVIAPVAPLFFQKWATTPRRPAHPYSKFVLSFFAMLSLGLLGLWIQDSRKNQSSAAVGIEVPSPQKPKQMKKQVRAPSSTATTAVSVPNSDPTVAKAAKRRKPTPKSRRRARPSRAHKKIVYAKPKAQIGRLRIEAWTTGGRQLRAKIQIDGRDVPKTTPISLRARAGKRKITITAPGYAPITQSAVVRSNEESMVQVIVDL